jgi:hypothetical protein
LAGFYCNQSFNTDTLRIIYKNDSLFSRRNANPNEWVLIPMEEDRYIGEESHITLAFIRNSTGIVSEVKFGEINTYKRIE